MPHFVYDDTALLFPKTNLNPIPPGGDPTKYVQSVDWNTANQAVADIKAQLRGARWYGVERQAVDPAPAGISDYLWSNTSGDLFFHTGGMDVLLTPAAATVTGGSNVGSGGGSVGPFKQLSGGVLEFKGIRPASAKLTVVDAIGTDDVDIDVAEGSLSHQNIGGAGTNTHATIDAQLPTANQKTDLGQLDGAPQGNIWFANAAGRVSRLAVGAASQVLTSQGAAADPVWAAAAVDASAIHNNVAGEINAVAVKGVPVAGDVILIEDSAGGFVKKKIDLTDLLGGAPHDLAGAEHNADTLANLNSKISDATLIDTADSRLSDARTPTAHGLGAAEHSADTLANLNAKVSDATLIDTADARLSDARTPTSHSLAGAEHAADTIANLQSKVSDATLAVLGAAQQYTKNQYSLPTVLTDGATVDYLASDSNIYELLATALGTRQLNNPTGIVKGMTWQVWYTQSVGGSEGITFDTYYDWGAEVPPDLSAQTGGEVNIFSCAAVSTTKIRITALLGAP